MDRIPVYLLADTTVEQNTDPSPAAGYDHTLKLLAQMLAPVAAHMTAVIGKDAGPLRDADIHTIPRRTGDGPLDALEAALADRNPAGWLLLASDPAGARPHPEWVQRMLRHRSAGVQCVLLRHQGRLNPLFALYHTSLRKRVAQAIEEGQCSMLEFIQTIPHVVLSQPRTAKSPPTAALTES